MTALCGVGNFGLATAEVCASVMFVFRCAVMLKVRDCLWQLCFVLPERPRSSPVVAFVLMPQDFVFSKLPKMG